MQQLSATGRNDEASALDVNGRLERIMELKEALKSVRNIPEEMALLKALTQEISALRQQLEPHYQ